MALNEGTYDWCPNVQPFQHLCGLLIATWVLGNPFALKRMLPSTLWYRDCQEQSSGIPRKYMGKPAGKVTTTASVESPLWLDFGRDFFFYPTSLRAKGLLGGETLPRGVKSIHQVLLLLSRRLCEKAPWDRKMSQDGFFHPASLTAEVLPDGLILPCGQSLSTE